LLAVGDNICTDVVALNVETVSLDASFGRLPKAVTVVVAVAVAPSVVRGLLLLVQLVY